MIDGYLVFFDPPEWVRRLIRSPLLVLVLFVALAGGCKTLLCPRDGRDFPQCLASAGSSEAAS